MTTLRVKNNHPVRKAIADLGDYWDSKGQALAAVDAALDGCNLSRDDDTFIDVHGDEGSVSFRLRDNGAGVMCCADCAKPSESNLYDNVVVFAYYKMREGRWEVITYVS